MENLSDDDYDHMSDVDMCESDGELAQPTQESAPSSPPSVHTLRASERKTQACPYHNCPKTFNRKARLEEHIRSHQNVRLFKCPHSPCDKDFLRRSHLTHHIKSAHSNIRDYACTWEGCDKSFATGTRLRRHLQTHEGKEKFRCRGYEGCSETFRKHDTLRRHILSVHEHIKPFPCTKEDTKTGETCDKAFETAEKLVRHQQNCHDSTRFSCAACLTGFIAPGQSATTTHTADLSQAAQSSAVFSTYAELQVHLAEVHPPTCQYCPTSFGTIKELHRHLELQHGQVQSTSVEAEKFPCTYPGCDRVFTKNGNLTVHVKTVHEKKKDFVCGVTEITAPEEVANQPDVKIFGCGRAFTSKATLTDHVRSAHLGLESKVVQGRKRRKTQTFADQGLDNDFHETKKRAPRKDKGVSKTSVFASLTGVPFINPEQNTSFVPDMFNSTVAYDDNDGNVIKGEDVEDGEDEWNQLSGSTTLFGNQLYHNGKAYQLSSSELPGVPSSSAQNGPHHHARSNSVNHTYSYVAAFDDEPIFDNFEHEPEFLGPIDPVLLRP